MTIEVQQTVKEIDITIEQNGNVVTIVPTVCTSCDGGGDWDGIVNGGTP